MNIWKQENNLERLFCRFHMNKRYQKHVFVCVNERPTESERNDCARCGGKDLRIKLVNLVNKNGLRGKVRINKSGCLDACEKGPAMVIYPNEFWYLNVKDANIEEIFTESVLGDNAIESLLANEDDFQKIKERRSQ
jgi:(2Fe-2S) ferredoxin